MFYIVAIIPSGEYHDIEKNELNIKYINMKNAATGTLIRIIVINLKNNNINPNSDKASE